MADISNVDIVNIKDPENFPLETDVLNMNFYSRSGGVNKKMTGAALRASVLSGHAGVTNLSLGTITDTTVRVLSDTGTSVLLPAATESLAGVMPAADKTVVNISSLVELTSVDATNDYLLIYDGSETGEKRKKVKLTNLFSLDQNIGNSDLTLPENRSLTLGAYNLQLLGNGKLLVGTTTPGEGKVVVSGGSVEILDTTEGIIAKSPNGTRWKATIANNGEWVTVTL